MDDSFPENRKADKERDKPRMVGKTMGLGSKKTGVQKEDTSIKEKQFKERSALNPSQMNAKKNLLGVAIRTSLSTSWRADEQ